MAVVRPVYLLTGEDVSAQSVVHAFDYSQEIKRRRKCTTLENNVPDDEFLYAEVQLIQRLQAYGAIHWPTSGTVSQPAPFPVGASGLTMTLPASGGANSGGIGGSLPAPHPGGASGLILTLPASGGAGTSNSGGIGGSLPAPFPVGASGLTMTLPASGGANSGGIGGSLPAPYPAARSIPGDTCSLAQIHRLLIGVAEEQKDLRLLIQSNHNLIQKQHDLLETQMGLVDKLRVELGAKGVQITNCSRRVANGAARLGDPLQRLECESLGTNFGNLPQPDDGFPVTKSQLNHMGHEQVDLLEDFYDKQFIGRDDDDLAGRRDAFRAFIGVNETE